MCFKYKFNNSNDFCSITSMLISFKMIKSKKIEKLNWLIKNTYNKLEWHMVLISKYKLNLIVIYLLFNFVLTLDCCKWFSLYISCKTVMRKLCKTNSIQILDKTMILKKGFSKILFQKYVEYTKLVFENKKRQRKSNFELINVEQIYFRCRQNTIQHTKH